MDKKELIFKISYISNKKDNLYYLFKGVLFSLDSSDICEIFDIKLNQDSFKKELILEKILKDLEVYLNIRTEGYVVSTNINLKNQKIYLPIFRKMLKLIKKTKNYRKNQEYAKFLYRMCPAMPKIWQKKLIQYFMSSEYKSNQRRALEYLNKNWNQDFSSDVVSLWNQNYSDTALDLMIWKIDNMYLNSDVLNSVDKYLKEIQDGDYSEYDYSSKRLRNKFYSRFPERYFQIIDKLRVLDPISYIFIQKESGGGIDKNFAIETYKNNINARKYLPRWYAEMGIVDILNNILENLNNFSSSDVSR